MATHQPHPASHNGDLNQQTNAHAANGKAKHHRSAEEDDDSIATEQFPEFDPLHDGNGDEDEQHELPHYTHAVGIGTVAPQQHSSDSAHDHEQVEVDGEEDDEDEEDDDTRSLSPVEPLPEPSHPADDDDDDIHTQRTTPPPITSPMTSPPYWVHGNQQDLHSTSRAQQQNNHNLSSDSLVPHGGITLQDNEAEEDEPSPQHQQRLQHPQQATGRGSEEMRTSYGRDRNKACWARSVEVSSYVIVNGSTTNIGAFVVWNIRVQTLSGPYMNIRKRYSEFDDFRRALIRTFPNFEAAVPVLPPKSVISRFRPRFLEKRRAGLQYFLNCILLNPEFSGSPVLKDFLFS